MLVSSLNWPDLIAATDRGKHGSLSFPSLIFGTSAVMFLVLKMEGTFEV